MDPWSPLVLILVLIVIFVFCVLGIVMIVLYQPRSIFSVRAFRNTEAKSDEETQAQMQYINWEKGFFRLTLALSVLLGIFAGMVDSTADFADFLIVFFTFFGLTWLVYFALRFTIKGFTDRRS